jgi:hypothetical protein
MFEHFLFRIDDDLSFSFLTDLLSDIKYFKQTPSELYTCMVCMDLLMFDSYNRDNTNIEIINSSSLSKSFNPMSVLVSIFWVFGCNIVGTECTLDCLFLVITISGDVCTFDCYK